MGRISIFLFGWDLESGLGPGPNFFNCFRNMFYKFLEIYFPILIEVDLAHYFFKLFGGWSGTFLILYETANLLFVYESIVVTIKQFESFFKLLLTKIGCNLCCKSDKLAETDFAWVIKIEIWKIFWTIRSA